MQRFLNILVYAPDAPETPALVSRAGELASRNGAHLTIVDVVPSVRSRPRRRSPIDLERVVARARRRELAEFASAMAPGRVSVDVMVGEPFLAIIDRVQREAHDLVLAAPDRPRRRFAGLAGASTVLHLLRKAPCPVWVDDPIAWGRADVVAAVGPFDEDGVRPLDRTIVELASSLAAIRGGTLHLVHGWRLEGETLLRSPRIGLEAGEVDEMLSDAGAEAEAAMRRLVETVVPVGSEPKVHVLKGRPGDVVASVVDEVRPEVVVMGTLARAGVEGVIIGNTAERIIDAIESSVIAVKPPGFVSPVPR
jgi:nucleotide-binding universal stress UspA family protein